MSTAETKTRQYTAEEIKDLTTVSRWKLRECSICDRPLSYHFSEDKEHVSFDSNCDCVSYWSSLQPRDWQDVAECINIQDDAAIQQRMLSDLSGVAS